jgi:hypothetical protein
LRSSDIFLGVSVLVPVALRDYLVWAVLFPAAFWLFVYPAAIIKTNDSRQKKNFELLDGFIYPVPE